MLQAKPDTRERLKRLAGGMTARIQFFRFLLVGGVNTLFGYGCYAVFIYLKLSYPVAMLFATGCGVLFNFITTGAVVFRKMRLVLLPRFILNYAGIYCISVVLLWGIHFFLSNDYLAGLIILLPMAIISFLLNKYLVFREST